MDDSLLITLGAQTYGYNHLPLLLSLAAPPLAVLLPNPLPPNAPQAVVDFKYPYANLRKQLRLLIEDPDPMEELENDISYVYSGFAPISVRLVQCVAQKGGVLSNPAADKDKKGGDGESSRRSGASPLVQAHPIVGWKGFEDVVASIPGETVDVVQRPPAGQDASAPPPAASLSACPRLHFRGVRRADFRRRARAARQCFRESGRRRRSCSSWAGARTRRSRRCAGWGARTKVSPPVLCSADRFGGLTAYLPPPGRKFLVATTGIVSGSSIVDSIVGTASATSKEVGL